MTTMKNEKTFWIKIYASGPIEEAKQIIRKDVLERGLCVTIEPTTFIYTGWEEAGYVVGLINYPRFPSYYGDVWDRALELARKLLNGTYQHSILLMSPDETIWITDREDI